MSLSTLSTDVPTALYVSSVRGAGSAKKSFDRALVRFDAWFLVFVAVILALGAALLAGMAIWCVVKQHKTFTGRWSFKDFGLKVYFECR